MLQTRFNHSVKVPRLYKLASAVSKEYKEGLGSIKQLVFEKQKKHPNLKAIFSLVYTLFDKLDTVERLLKRSQFFTKEPRCDEWLAKVLIVELLWGKGSLPGNSKPVETIRAYEQIFKAHLSDEKEANDTEQKVSDFSKPRYVRVNTLKSTLEQAIENFQSEGWTLLDNLDKSDYDGFIEKVKSLDEQSFLVDIHIPNLLIFPPKTEFYNHPAYKKGSIILQDKASCLPVHILNPPPGSIVLDMCAAPGMKTTHLAAVLNDKGKLYAVERDPRRFEILLNIVESSGAQCVETINTDVLACFGDSYKHFQEVEYIVVDPSCSGSGMTTRHEPLKVNAGRLKNLAGFQIKILRSALTRFPKAKRVVYSTCSTFSEENEDVVRQVLETNYNFKLVSAKQFLCDTWKNFGSSDFGEIGKFCLYAKPNEDLTNGFFVAVFERLEEGEENTFFNNRIFNFKKKLQYAEKKKEIRNMKNLVDGKEENKEDLPNQVNQYEVSKENLNVKEEIKIPVKKMKHRRKSTQEEGKEFSKVEEADKEDIPNQLNQDEVSKENLNVKEEIKIPVKKMKHRRKSTQEERKELSKVEEADKEYISNQVNQDEVPKEGLNVKEEIEIPVKKKKHKSKRTQEKEKEFLKVMEADHIEDHKENLNINIHSEPNQKTKHKNKKKQKESLEIQERDHQDDIEFPNNKVAEDEKSSKRIKESGDKNVSMDEYSLSENTLIKKKKKSKHRTETKARKDENYAEDSIIKTEGEDTTTKKKNKRKWDMEFNGSVTEEEYEKKKTKKRKHIVEGNESTIDVEIKEKSILNEEIVESNDNEETNLKLQIRKKKKTKLGIDSEIYNTKDIVVNKDVEFSQHVHNKEHKKHKKIIQNDESVIEIIDDFEDKILDPAKKKRKKNKGNKSSIENVEHESNIEARKKIKKRKEKIEDVSDDQYDVIEVINLDDSGDSAILETEKKKKKKKKIINQEPNSVMNYSIISVASST